MNHYNRTLTLGWLANTDISPCTSAGAVINYMAKYVSKAEKKTSTFNDVAAKIICKIKEGQGITAFVNKFMNTLAAERDISAQEVTQIALGLPLCQFSRTVITVDCRTPDKHWKANIINGSGQVRASLGLYAKYLARPEHLSQLSYFNFIESAGWDSTKIQEGYMGGNAAQRETANS
ncbi:hypothetical protein E4U56_006043 [Claviceps arundinis]|uniref:Uncharacterized protein n=1 Tax=Claviceps arundinis TaxID=1623583 RepID=A0A9P7MLY0_9HYPO|nr:hypothetical protein E4U56_006043 [Claviceps arundinis]